MYVDNHRYALVEVKKRGVKVSPKEPTNRPPNPLFCCQSVSPKKGIVVKPMVSFELNSRCQVDLINLQLNSDGEYKFIMVYQDHLAKFVQLRPLKTKGAEKVAHYVLSIFLIFSAPAILHSDSGEGWSYGKPYFKKKY